MKRPVAIIIVVFVIIIGLSIVQVSVANQLSTTGTELATLEQQIDQYKRENTQLQENVLVASSYTNISERAKKRGFVSSKSMVYLTTPPPLALKQ